MGHQRTRAPDHASPTKRASPPRRPRTGQAGPALRQLQQNPLALAPTQLLAAQHQVGHDAVADILGPLFVQRQEAGDAPAGDGGAPEITPEEAERQVAHARDSAASQAGGGGPAGGEGGGDGGGGAGATGPTGSETRSAAQERADAGAGGAGGGEGAGGERAGGGDAGTPEMSSQDEGVDGLAVTPATADSTIPNAAEMSAPGGHLAQYAEEEAWHDAWAAGGGGAGMASLERGELVVEAMGAGATEGLTGGLAAAVVGQVVKHATKSIPYASGFLAAGEMVLKGQSPVEWGTEQFSAGGKKVSDGWGKLWGGDSDWIDRIEGFVDILDGLNSFIGTISTICFIVAGVLALAGIVLAIFGVGAALLTFAAFCAKAGLFLGKIATIVGIIVTALRLIIMAARAAQIMLSDADPSSQAKRADSLRRSTGEFSKELTKSLANRKADEMAEKAQKNREAATRPPDQPDESPTPAAAGTGPQTVAETQERRGLITRGLDAISAGEFSKESRAAGQMGEEGWGGEARERYLDEDTQANLEAIRRKQAERAAAGAAPVAGDTAPSGPPGSGGPGSPQGPSTQWPMAGVPAGEELRLSYPEEGGPFRYETGPRPAQNPFADLSDDELGSAVDPRNITRGEMGGMTRDEMAPFDPMLQPPAARPGFRSPFEPPGPAAFGEPGAEPTGYHGAMGQSQREVKGDDGETGLEPVRDAEGQPRPGEQGASREGVAYHPAEVMGVTQFNPQNPNGESYCVRVGVGGSYTDHIFNSRTEADSYAQQVAQGGAGPIRSGQALPHDWPGGKAGNPVTDVNVFPIGPNKPFLRSGVAPQPESGPSNAGQIYPGGGPQVQLPYGTLTPGSKPSATFPVQSPASPAPAGVNPLAGMTDAEMEEAIGRLGPQRPSTPPTGGAAPPPALAPGPPEPTAPGGSAPGTSAPGTYGVQAPGSAPTGPEHLERDDVVSQWERFRKGGEDTVASGITETLGFTGEDSAFSAATATKEEAAAHREQWVKDQRDKMDAAHQSMTADLPPPPRDKKADLDQSAKHYAELDVEERQIRFQHQEIDVLEQSASDEMSATQALQQLMTANQQAITKEQQELSRRGQAQEQLRSKTGSMGQEAGQAGSQQQSQSGGLQQFVGKFSEMMGLVPSKVVGNSGQGSSAAGQLGQGFQQGGQGTKDGQARAQAAGQHVDELQSQTQECKTSFQESNAEITNLKSLASSSMDDTRSGKAYLRQARDQGTQKLQEIADAKQSERTRQQEALQVMSAWAEQHYQLRTTGHQALDAQMTQVEGALPR